MVIRLESIDVEKFVTCRWTVEWRGWYL